MVKGKTMHNIFISPPQPNNHLWYNEHQSFVPVAQTIYLGVTL